MATRLQDFWQALTRRVGVRNAAPAPRVPATAQPSGSAAAVEIAPDDPLTAYFLSAPGVVEVDKLNLSSPALAAMRAAGVRREWTWVEDGSAWTYRECDDLDAAESSLSASDPVRSWWGGMAGVLDERTRQDGRRRTREVFRCD